MNAMGREQVENHLNKPSQERVDVPINNGALIPPIEFIGVMGCIRSSHQEVFCSDGSSQYRVIKQLSRFGDMILIDYYEAKVYDKNIIETFGLPMNTQVEQYNHNIKISHSGNIFLFRGICRYKEIVDVRRVCGKEFFIKIKTYFGEVSWVKL